MPKFELSPKPKITMNYIDKELLIHAAQAVKQFIQDYSLLDGSTNHYFGYTGKVKDILELIDRKYDYDFFVSCTKKGNITLDQVV